MFRVFRPAVPIFLLLAFLRMSLPTIPATAQGEPQTTNTGRVAYLTTAGDQTRLAVMSADGSAQQVLTSTEGNFLAPDEAPSWSPDGTQIAFVAVTASGTRELAVVDVDGDQTSLLTILNGTVSHPVWSPDGQRIAFAAALNGPADIYTIRPDGTDPINVTAHPADDRAPTWNPDASRLAFQSDRDSSPNGPPDIYTIRTDGTDLLRLTTNPAADHDPVWSPEGMRVAFSSNRDGNENIFVVDFNSTNLVRLSDTPHDDSGPAWSPDGVFVAFEGALAPDVSELFVINADGIALRQLTIDNARFVHPAWAPNGDWITFASNRNGSFDLYALTSDAAQWVALSHDPASDLTHPVWTATTGAESAPTPTSTPTTTPLPTLQALPSATPQTSLGALPTATQAAIAISTLPILPTNTLRPTLPPSPIPSPTYPPTLTPIPTFTPVPVPDLTLIYDPFVPLFYLVNTSGQRVNISGISFSGDGRTIGASIWNTTGMSGSLFDFPVGGCLGLWGLNTPVQPEPAPCVHRHGWWSSDDVVFWTTSQFTVFNNGTPVAVCASDAGQCSVDFDGRTVTAPAPVPATVPPSAQSQPADLLLVFDSAMPSFYLVNTSGRWLDLSPLRFQGNGRSISPDIWTRFMTGTIYSFRSGDCLGLWGYGVPRQPPPAECATRQGWVESNDWIFWIGESFSVTYNGAAIAACAGNTGACSVTLP